MGFSRHEYWSGLPFPYGGVNGNLRQEGLCHTQVYCTESLCSHSSLLLTRTSSGDTQIQVCLSLCGVSGSWCAQGMFESSERLQDGWVMVENSDKTWSPGEGNGKPLHYSCLENPRDVGAWWAAVYGVAQSRT